MIIKPNYIAMDPVKLRGIADWPAPSTVKQVRSFLGFSNFYRRFIHRYSTIARPLIDLTKKEVRFEWTTECQTAFDTLKDLFGEAPVLQMPDTGQPFAIAVDASKFATGGVLMQKDSNGLWHPCAYLSQSFSPAERNYEIFDRELLAIVRALKTWRHYIEGSPFPVRVDTDHLNLTYFRSPQKLNRRQARWFLLLSQFDLKLGHIPGKDLAVPDALSRRSDHILSDEDDNDKVTLLPDNLFVNVIDIALTDKLRQSSAADPIVEKALLAMESSAPPPMKSALSDWKFEDGILTYKSRIYVPEVGALRRELVKRNHDLPSAGHPGRFKTQELVQRLYWWPGMATFIRKYVEGCALCQKSKVNTHPTTPPLNPIAAPTSLQPFAQVSVDLITDLPLSHGYDSLMVVVDHGLTKGVILSPCNKTIDAAGVADLFHQNVYKRFGLYEKIISDRGPQFASTFAKELGRILGTEIALSTAYHPQSDGETERVNQEIEVYLRIFCGNNQQEWTTHLAAAEFMHNHRHHSARNASPFFLMLGYNPKSIPSIVPKTDVPAVAERLAELTKAREEALAAHELARQIMRERITKKFIPFKEGEQVWLEGRNLKLGYENRKLAPKREGPFKIIKVLGPLTYKLQLPDQWRIHPVFHAHLLSRYHENEEHGRNFLEPPPDIIEGEEEYEVEAVLNHKGTGRCRKYLIKWKGYSSADNTWEPEVNLMGTQELLDDYKRRKHLR